jgi:hypothetical protein
MSQSRGSSRGARASLLPGVLASVAANPMTDKTLVLPYMLHTLDWGESEGVNDHHIRVVLLGRL